MGTFGRRNSRPYMSHWFWPYCSACPGVPSMQLLVYSSYKMRRCYSDGKQGQCLWNIFSSKIPPMQLYSVQLFTLYGATAMTESPRAGTVFVKYILLTDVNGCPSAPSPAPTATVAWDLLKWKMCAADICHRGVLTLLEWPTFARTASQKQSASVGDKLNFPFRPIEWQWC